jgi:2'-5' RNA ligase
VPQLFVGVWPPPKVVKVLGDYPRPARDGLRWSTPSQWLVVVRPLGHVADALVPALADTLRFELDGMPKPKATLTTPRHGGWLRTPVDGLEELTDVVFEVTEPLVPRTHPNNPWEVSIVLARGRSPRELVEPLSGSWTVGEVVLARGTRGKQGPGYETVEAFRLG